MTIKHIPAFFPKKRLGQNFLLDHNIARKMIRMLDLQQGDLVVEIGPGFGILTQLLVEANILLIAVELDGELAHWLAQKFAARTNFQLIRADFLDLDLTNFKTGNKKIRIIGNIPYHITSPVIFKILDQAHLVQDLTLMIQREVAERIVAKPGSKDYGVLSINSQATASCKLLFRVPKTVFSPRPEVESAVVGWAFEPARWQLIKDLQLFRLLVKTAFLHRRKMLRNSLAEFIAQIPLAELPIDNKRRPESLSVQEWVEFSNFIATRRL